MKDAGLRMLGRALVVAAMAGAIVSMAFTPLAVAQAPATTAVKPKADPAKSPPAAKASPSKQDAPKPADANAAPKEETLADEKAAAERPGDQVVSETEPAEGSGLPIPRFVSLRTDPINLRSGPGLQYPVEWVYHRKRLPVEVVKEFDTWRRIRDPDGVEGWVHQSMITGHRTAIVRSSPQALRRNDGDDASAVATVEAGVVVAIQRCPAESRSCRVQIDGFQGWLKREYLWGVYPNETVE